MAKHRKYGLLEQVVQAINECGWNALYAGDISEHPFLLKVYKDDESYLLRIYIWNLTHGGGAERPADEYRIQITGVDHFTQPPGERTLILGWWQDVSVFAGFDFLKHNGRLGASPSIQIREQNLRNALTNGFSPCDRGNGEMAIAFRPDFFIEYVRNLRSLHQIGDSAGAIELVEQVASGVLQINSAQVQGLPAERRTVITSINKKLRDNGFNQRVLSAYGYQCAFSGIQLKLIDAAHIIPVSEGESTDDTFNGIALSPLYHRAYDRGLITFNEQYQIIVNKEKLETLRKYHLAGGADIFTRHLRPIIVVPSSVSDRPNIHFITVANKLRGWPQ